MNPPVQYTLYHPKWYRRTVSVWWWLENWSYTRFVLREITSVFVAFFALIYLGLVRSLVAGPVAYAHFMARLQSPWFLILHIVTLLFVLFHAITWFNLAPKAMVLRLGGKRVPDFVIVAGNYLVWLVASAVVAWFFLRG